MPNTSPIPGSGSRIRFDINQTQTAREALSVESCELNPRLIDIDVFRARSAPPHAGPHATPAINIAAQAGHAEIVVEALVDECGEARNIKSIVDIVRVAA